MQLSKKELSKKKGTKEIGHWEGKYWCDCKTRNIRRWLGLKKYGKEDLKVNPSHGQCNAPEQ